MTKYSSFIYAFCILTALSACRVSHERETSSKTYILATTGMIADMVKHIVGDSAYVEALMNPGVDPHLYKASQGDLQKILDADYIIYNGLHLEGKLANILEKQQRIKPVLAVGNSLKHLINVDQHTYDPHIWFDVRLWKSAVTNTVQQLAILDSANAAYYLANAAAYQTQLDTLDQWVRSQLDRIPPSHRILVTAHDAFSYFGRAYGVQVKGLQGISTLSEFGLRDVSGLVDYVVQHRIPAVFVESSVSDRSLNAVIAGAKQRGHKLVIGGHLFSDAMGAANTPEGNYIGMIKYNVRTIVEALTTDNAP